MHVNSLIRLFKHKFHVLKTNKKSFAPFINWELAKTKINSVFAYGSWSKLRQCFS